MVQGSRVSAKHGEAHAYDYVVGLPVPPGGFGRRLNQMISWCHEFCGNDGFRTLARMRGSENIIEFRFHHGESADAFKQRFAE